MKILVVYTSRETGNSRKLAEAIAAKFGDSCVLANAADAPKPDNFDFIALGFGLYRGWPDGDMRAFMKRCRKKDVGLFMTLGAWPDSEFAYTALGRAEGLLENCKTRVKFVCQGGYTDEYIERLKAKPAGGVHGWTPEREERIMEACKHPDESDLNEAAERFYNAVEKLKSAPVRKTETKKAIVLSVFGSTIPSALKSYDTIETAIKDKNPGVPFFRAFTSGIVRKRIDYSVPSLPGVLRQLVIDKFTDVDIVAGFLAPGEEYHKMLRDVSAFSSTLNTTVSRPPLSSLAELQEFLKQVTASIPAERKSGECVLFMGHGNNDGRSDFQYMAAASELKKIDTDFHLACVEGNPDIDSVIEQVSSKRVWLVPFMLVAGDHAINDMAGDDDDSWKSMLEAKGHECSCVLHGLGESPEIAAYFADRIS